MNSEINQNWIIDDLVTKWEGNKKYTLEVLEAMPESAYEYSPHSDLMSFHKQAVHIEYAFHYHWRATSNPPLPKLDPTSKASMIASFTQIFDDIIASFRQMDPTTLPTTISMWYGPSSLNRVMNLMDNHLAHHRGQMCVYLRMQGIKPPKYIGW